MRHLRRPIIFIPECATLLSKHQYKPCDRRKGCHHRPAIKGSWTPLDSCDCCLFFSSAPTALTALTAPLNPARSWPDIFATSALLASPLFRQFFPPFCSSRPSPLQPGDYRTAWLHESPANPPPSQPPPLRQQRLRDQTPLLGTNRTETLVDDHRDLHVEPAPKSCRAKQAGQDRAVIKRDALSTQRQQLFVDPSFTFCPSHGSSNLAECGSESTPSCQRSFGNALRH